MNLLINIIKSISGAIIEPPMIFILIILAMVLYSKNRKISVMQKLILGDSVNSSIELTLSQIVLGIFAGGLGSIILNFLGVVFYSNSGIVYLFLISIILMFINPRLICFSYSGALLGLISIFEEIILTNSSILSGLGDINIMHLMIFIGVMHVVEGILVMIDGSRGAVPVFTNRDDKILGGYVLKRYWILPISFIIMISGTDFNNNYIEITEFPNWWPLIGSGIAALSAAVLMPFYGMIGYSSITFTRNKREKAFISGCCIFLYGIILILISQFASIGLIGEIIVVICAPVLHEFMLKIQRINEENREARFVSDDEGLVILEVIPGCELSNQGVKCGDKIISVNNKKISCESEIYTLLKKSLYQIDICIKTKTGDLKHILVKHNKKKRIGVLLVPAKVKEDEIIEVKDKDFKSVLKEAKEKDIE